MSRDITEGESMDVVDDGSRLRFWQKDGTITVAPFKVAAAAPELLALVREFRSFMGMEDTEVGEKADALLARIDA